MAETNPRREIDMHTARSAAVGEIISVFARCEPYNQMRLADLEWMVFPAVANRQFAILRGAGPERVLTPAALALWADVSPSVDLRLTATQERNTGTVYNWNEIRGQCIIN
jgi:hemolysin-activating ACP:hemolysin acyltransferase